MRVVALSCAVVMALWASASAFLQPANAQESPACALPALAEPPTGLDFSDLHALADGTGVRVAVIDTGVAAHEQLREVIAGADLVEPHQPNPLFDCDGHGTAVAGIIAARDAGIAPGATIVSIRQTSALVGEDNQTSGSLETLTSAIEVALDIGVDVINVSVVSCVPPELAGLVDDHAMRAALARAEAAGVVVVAAAGNQGPACADGDVVYPAHLPTVVAVGALADSHTLAPYSLPVASAPGNTVVAARGDVPVALSPAGWAHGLYPAGGDPLRSNIVSYHGTSYATPQVTGVVALLKQRYPTDSAAQVRHRLASSALPHTGAIDAYRSLTYTPSFEQPAGRTVRLPAPPPDPVSPSLRTARVLAGLLAALLALVVLYGAGRRVEGT